MNKLLPKLSIFALMMLLYSQCQENENHSVRSEESLIMEAKDFFDKKVMYAYQEIDTNNPIALLPKKLKWEDAYITKLSIGKGIIVPMHYDKRYVIKNNQDRDRYHLLDNLTRLLIYKDAKNVYRAEVIKYFPDRSFKSFKKPFTGFVRVEDWFGKLIKSYSYGRNGEIKQLNLTQRTPSNSLLETVTICYTVYGYNYSEQGGTYYWSETYCDTFTYYSSGSGGTTGGDYGGTGGGNNNDSDNNNGGEPCYDEGGPLARDLPLGEPCEPAPSVPQPFEIINEVENPCLQRMTSNFIHSATDISTKIETEFGRRANIDLIFAEGNLTSGDINHAWATTRKQRVGDLMKVVITLDNSKLVGTTNEFVSATLIHEAYHAYHIVCDPPNSSNDLSHNLMADPAMITKMATDLRTMYPAMDMQTAQDLSWAGLEGTTAYQNLSASDQRRIYETNRDYRYGAKGTKCQ